MSGSNRYNEFEELMAAALISGCVIFVLYLIVASVSILFLKWLLAILNIAICIGGLGILICSGELTRPRSLWLGCGFFGLLACQIVSLILNYPA